MPRILLLEDEETVRALMEHLLLGELADLMLPDGTGTIIAHEAQRSGTPAIIVTAYAAQFPKADVAHFQILLKPVRPAELLQVVADALKPASDT